MIKVKRVFDSNGNVVKRYILTKGDSFRLKAKIRANSEQDLVKSLTFKIATHDFKQIFSKEFLKGEDGWYLIVNSNETIDFVEGRDYRSEVEVVFIDDGNDTYEKAQFWVVNQIEEGDNEC